MLSAVFLVLRVAACCALEVFAIVVAVLSGERYEPARWED